MPLPGHAASLPAWPLSPTLAPNHTRQESRMTEYYLAIRWLHIAAVILSGSLFFLRGLLVLAGHSRLAMGALPRYLSIGIDSVLLAAAIALTFILQQYPFVTGWLSAKVVSADCLYRTGFIRTQAGPQPLSQSRVLPGRTGRLPVHRLDRPDPSSAGNFPLDNELSFRRRFSPCDSHAAPGRPRSRRPGRRASLRRARCRSTGAAVSG